MSKHHQMLVTIVAGHLQRLGYKIEYLEGNYRSVTMMKPAMPPKIRRHRPDVFAIKDMAIGIGEAKTLGDLKSRRTRSQLIDFKNVVQDRDESILVIGIPMKAKEELMALLNSLGIELDNKLMIIAVPEVLLENA